MANKLPSVLDQISRFLVKLTLRTANRWERLQINGFCSFNSLCQFFSLLKKGYFYLFWMAANIDPPVNINSANTTLRLVQAGQDTTTTSLKPSSIMKYRGIKNLLWQWMQSVISIFSRLWVQALSNCNPLNKALFYIALCKPLPQRD